MNKGPKRLLHMNQPTMHSINVTNLICNDPTIPRRQKLGRFRCITRATRTLPCNMIKRAKFSATIPNAHGGRTMRPPRAAGEKVAPQAKVLASAQEAANLRVACQSIGRKYPAAWWKQSSWASRCSDAMWRRKHQARQASRTTCWRWPMSPAEEKSKRQPESEWVHFHSAIRSQPCEANRESKAYEQESHDK